MVAKADLRLDRGLFRSPRLSVFVFATRPASARVNPRRLPTDGGLTGHFFALDEVCTGSTWRSPQTSENSRRKIRSFRQ